MKTLVDLSKYQTSANFKQLKEAGIWGVCLRASSGVSYIDPTFYPRARRARKHGLVVLSYHFAYLNDPIKEANHYCDVMSHRKKALNGRPMLDIEIPSAGIDVEEWSHRFIQRVISRGFPRPLFYSNPSYITEHHFKKPIGSGLVLAAYGPNDGKDHPVECPSPWKYFVAHQFTSKGRVNGVPGFVDKWHSTHPRKLRKPTNIIFHSVTSYLDSLKGV